MKNPNEPSPNEFFDSQKNYERKETPQNTTDMFTGTMPNILFPEGENLSVFRIAGEDFLTRDIEFLTHRDGRVLPRSVVNLGFRLTSTGRLVPDLVIGGVFFVTTPGCEDYHEIRVCFVDGIPEIPDLAVHIVRADKTKRCSYCQRLVCLKHAHTFRTRSCLTTCPSHLQHGLAEVERIRTYLDRKAFGCHFLKQLGFHVEEKEGSHK